MAKRLCEQAKKFVRIECCLAFSRYSKFLLNTTAQELIVQTRGLPLKLNGDDYEICFAGDEASATAFGMEFERYCVQPGEKSERKILAFEHGHVVVSAEGLPHTDPLGAEYDEAALLAVLDAMAPKVRIADNRENLIAQAG